LQQKTPTPAAGDWIPISATGVPTERGALLLMAAMSHAAGDALYGDYVGGSGFLAAAQFITASQALQGVAQAAGEFGPPGSESCMVAAWAQLAVMTICTAVLLWTRPHRVRRNYYAELLPTAAQTGLCAAVAILAARRSSPNATIAAWLGVALEVTCMLQPALAVSLALFDAFV
jgi:hypothetical protein